MAPSCPGEHGEAAVMIQVEQLGFAYGHGAPVFAGFDWQAARGEAWAVLGPSGCGKSTLLHLVAGLLAPTSGVVRVAGQELTRPRPQTGLIIQDFGLLPWATVRQNAELGLRVRNFYGPDGTHAPRDYQPSLAVRTWLERLSLSDVADSYPGQISGGQRQRTAIARTLALNQDLMLELRAENGLTQVVVTHSIEEAAVLGQKILLLGLPPNGQAEVIENPAAGFPGYRETDEYLAVVRHLRERLNRR